ncbi:MAG TPA: transglutaminase family protein [Acetobacteraceae bacterium]|jgi:transglutaminase-like putative cysteine protease|nr:transglutaminase family protein [Acetobacteraceae bacterium]
MPHVRVEHITTYRYSAPVRLTEHRLMLRPRDSHDLRLNDATLGLTPPAAQLRWSHDVQGNSVCFVDFGDARADVLTIISTLDLDHFPAETGFPIDPSAAIYPFSYPVEELPDLARLAERHLPDPGHALDRWARRFLNTRGPTRTLSMLTAMTEAIKADFVYEARDAEGTNAPNITLKTGRGACRDLALLMMEATRALGFAARFVSGYVYDAALVDSADAVVGGGATHAWCSIYLPGAGWVEFDPTNGLIAGRNLIRVSVARTPEQAVPVAGGFIGRPNDFLSLGVDVTVSVGAQVANADA